MVCRIFSTSLRTLALAASLGVIALAIGMVSPASAQFVVINEIFNDPGGMGDDERDEYIELRGTPGMSLQNMYLVFIENEDNFTHTGNAGIIENIFTLGDNPNTPSVEVPHTIGTNGFLTFRQNSNLYGAPPAGTTDLVNTANSSGWGSDSASAVRHSGEAGKTRIENSGFTAMLIRNNGDPFLNQPFLGLDLDQGNNGLDPSGGDKFGWRSAWEIVDSIGIHGEVDEANGRLYGKVNFGQNETANIEPDAQYHGGGYEIELIARWGDSTGQTLANWHATNVSDRTVEGYFSASAGLLDYRQSGGFHNNEPETFVETHQYVPYGTPLTTTLGAPNYPLNLEHLPWDGDGDDSVDGNDFLAWQRTLSDSGLGIATDYDGSGTVDAQDLAFWKARFGYSWSDVPGYVTPSLTPGMIPVPEPTSSALLSLGMLAIVVSRSQSKRLIMKA